MTSPILSRLSLTKAVSSCTGDSFQRVVIVPNRQIELDTFTDGPHGVHRRGRGSREKSHKLVGTSETYYRRGTALALDNPDDGTTRMRVFDRSTGRLLGEREVRRTGNRWGSPAGIGVEGSELTLQ